MTVLGWLMMLVEDEWRFWEWLIWLMMLVEDE